MVKKKQRLNIATARFGSGKGNTLKIEFNEVEDDYVCPECAKEITKKQLEDSYVDYLRHYPIKCVSKNNLGLTLINN